MSASCRRCAQSVPEKADFCPVCGVVNPVRSVGSKLPIHVVPSRRKRVGPVGFLKRLWRRLIGSAF